jgi:putative nucleotidyltransferase with HDIG domain
MKSRKEEILRAIQQVPPFPQVVIKALVLLEKPEVPASELVEVLRYDPVITARVLRLCNSAAFGLQVPVESLQQALVMLGNQQMMKILAASGAMDLLRGEIKGYGLEEGELWRHSVACALMAQILHRVAGMEERPVVFTSALLHDIGKVVLNRFSQEEYREILARVRRHCSAIEAEREVLGTDHAEIGGLLAQEWNFPEEIALVIQGHHRDVVPGEDPWILCLVHLANILCIQMGIGTGDLGMASRSSPEVVRAMGWTSRDLEGFLSSCWEELQEVQDLLELAHD